MAVINVTSGSQAVLTLGTTEAMSLPGGIRCFSNSLNARRNCNQHQLDQLDIQLWILQLSSAFTTVNENSVSLNMLLDGAVFLRRQEQATNTISNKGLLETSSDKTEIFWSLWRFNEGNTTGEYYVKGKGFLSGLTPTASIDAAVWVTPMEIIVNGEITKVIVS